MEFQLPVSRQGAAPIMSYKKVAEVVDELVLIFHALEFETCA